MIQIEIGRRRTKINIKRKTINNENENKTSHLFNVESIGAMAGSSVHSVVVVEAKDASGG